MNQLSFRLLSLNNLIFLGLSAGLGVLAGCEKAPVPLTTNSVITGGAGFGTGGDYSGIMVVANDPYDKYKIYLKKDKYIQGWETALYLSCGRVQPHFCQFKCL